VPASRSIPLVQRTLAPLALLPWLCAIHGQALAGQPDLLHRVRQGDTLEALSAHYLGDARLWPKLQTVNHVANPRRLRPGSTLRIPANLLPAGHAEASFVQGQVQVSPAGSQVSTPLQPGQALPEGSRLYTGPQSFVSVRLADGTVVRIQADSDVFIEQLRKRGRAGDAQSVLELRKGAVEPSVPPQPGSARHFEIRTPSASTSVRGTRFTVALTDDGRTLAAVTKGTLAVAGRGPAPTPDVAVQHGHGLAVAANGQPGQPQTLLPAPDLAELPALAQDADFLRLTLPSVAGAVAYQVELARDADFTAVIRSGRFSDTQIRLPAPDDGSYHVAVRAFDASGLPGLMAQRPITVKARPVPPLYQAPAANGTLARTLGTLQCTPVVGAQRYRIQVAPTADFASPLLDETRAAQCTLPVAALPPGSYFWRAASVRDLGGAGLDQGPYATPQAFNVADQPRAVDANALQAGGAGPVLRLRWPADAGQTFRLQVAADSGFAKPLVDERLDTPAWTATALAPGAYYVRIQTRDPSGLESLFSTPRRIEVEAHVQSGFGLPVTASDGTALSPP